MYALNYYGSMDLKEWMFRWDERAIPATEDEYRGWREVLEGNGAHEWNRITTCFTEDFQFAILRAVTVTGTCTDRWSSFFQRISERFSPFEDLTRLYMRGLLGPDWHYFAEKIAVDIGYSDRHFPCVYPEWLFPYGYLQRQYLADLALYWDNIPADYSVSWNIAPIGHDSPDIARLKKLGEQARFEIDQIARHSEKYFKR